MGKRQVSEEAYLTSPSAAAACLASLARRYPLDDFARIIEPSAGDGAFLDLLPPERRIGVDIRATRDDVIEQDFLTWTPPPADVAQARTLVVGNPPFGQRGALALRFIEHAAGFADVIAFILPRGFAKDTFVNRWPASFHLVHAEPVDDAFRLDGRAHAVRTVFQVWERRSVPRPRIVRATQHPHFTMTHAHLSRVCDLELERLRREHAFALPQVGTHFRPREVAAVTAGSLWFIRPCAPSVRTAFERLDFGFLDGMSTAHTSLSKADIVQAYTAALDADPGLAARIERESAGAGAIEAGR